MLGDEIVTAKQIRVSCNTRRLTCRQRRFGPFLPFVCMLEAVFHSGTRRYCDFAIGLLAYAGHVNSNGVICSLSRRD